ncbi:MAG: glycosyltransferase [Candidatus Rokubacteria bacterium]|nr:glycosyltransferase [Candidatus Rokubacteria bacterium]
MDGATSRRPLISVVIPAYNVEAYVGAAIESVLRQTYGHYEVVVVDDGSTDGTAAAVRRYGSRVRYVHRPNGGLAAARNTGLDHSTGEIVVFLDADDLLLPEALEAQAAVFADDPGVGVVYAWARYVDQDGALLDDAMRTAPGAVTLRRILLGGNSVLFSLAAVRRVVFERVGRFDETLRQSEDWDMILRMLVAGVPFRCVPRMLVHRRVHTRSLSADPAKALYWDRRALDKAFMTMPLPPECRRLAPAAHFGVLHRAAMGSWRRGDRQTAVARLREGFAVWPAALYRPQTYLTVVGRLLPSGLRSPDRILLDLDGLAQEAQDLVRALVEHPSDGVRVNARAAWSTLHAVLALLFARKRRWRDAARHAWRAFTLHPLPPLRGATLMALRTAQPAD